VRVIVQPQPGEIAATEAAITAAGGQIEAHADGLVQALVAPGSLRRVAASAAVKNVSPPAVPVADGVDEGVVDTGADVWQTSGAVGTGVKIGIIDLGFYNYQSLLGTALPASVVTDDRCGGNLSASPAAGGTEHGTAVAEVVHQMAPGAQLYLMCVDSEVDLALAEQDAVADGVRIINHSVSWFDTSRGDGTGEPGSPDDTVAAARAHGILWVNAAGNMAEDHWSGTFSPDASDPAYTDFVPGDATNVITMASGEQACVYLKWDDWPVTSEDFDLGLFTLSGTEVAASSDDQSDGPLPPTEVLCYTNAGAQQQFEIAITRYSAVGNPRFDLYYSGESALEYSTAAGSVTEPASAPGALAVGADCWQTNTLEPYSSQGPSIDGRTLPALLAPDSVSTQTYGAATPGSGGCGASGFAGTSSASPQVAGAAADVLQEQPSLSPAGLEATVEARSLARSGATHRANDSGDGQLRLGQTAGAGTIAYATSNGSITSLLNVTDADGGSTHLLLDNAFAPSWSPDGTELAIDTNNGLETIDADGTNRQVIVSAPGANAQDPSWSPDGTKIAYATDDPADGNGIWVVPAAGGTPTELIGVTPQVTAPVWSPDGSKIAFLRQSGVGASTWNIWIMNANGSIPAELVTTNAPDPGAFGDRNLAWSPDGTKLLFANTLNPPVFAPGQNPDSIAVANVNGTGDSILIDADVPSGSNFTDPEWSPDGDQIIFGNTPEQGPDRLPQGLYIANADGTGTTELLGAPGGYPIKAAQWTGHDLVANQSLPTVTGTAVAGQTLAADPGLWSDTSGSTYTFAWERCNASGAGCATIGASDSSYTLAGADVGSTLRVNVTGADGATSKSALSAASAVVVGASPFATALPTLSGIALTGQVLTATTGTWPNVGLPFTYQWLRCDGNGANCAGIGGATANSYTLTCADAGSTLRAAVGKAWNGTTVYSTSSAGGPITAFQCPSGGGGGGGGGGSIPDLAVTVAGPTQIAVGGQASFAVAVADLDGAGANGIHLLLTLPAGAAVDQASADRGPGCGPATAGTVDCNLDFLSGTLVAHVTLVLTLPTAGHATLAASVSDSQGDKNPANNTTSVTVQVGSTTTTTTTTTTGPAPPPKPAALRRINGTAKANHLTGTAKADLIEAGGGNDWVNGGAGNDQIYGGSGNDTLYGGPGNDLLNGGPGLDKIFGGPGNDTIRAADGVKDTIDCGTGRDVVYADKHDKVAKNCEVVHRS
jgi:Tol biopolymer transport system component